MPNKYSFIQKRKRLPRLFFIWIAGLFLRGDLCAQQRETRAVYFDYDSYQLSSTMQKLLGNVVLFCLAKPRIKRIEIQGYADTSGSTAYNLSLSDKRAGAVKNYLMNHGLGSQSPKMLVNFYGEGRAKNRSVEEQRTVVIHIYFALPDRDTVLRMGCVSVKINANSFGNFNVNELDLQVTYAGDAEAAQRNNLVMQDNNGNTLLSNGMVKLDVRYRGQPVQAEKAIEFTLPELNNRGEFAVYSGYKENGVVKWKKTDEKIEKVENSPWEWGGCGSFYTFATRDVNSWKNIDKVDACVCSSDGFGGMSTPPEDAEFAIKGARGSLLIARDPKANVRNINAIKNEWRDMLSEEELSDYCARLVTPDFLPLPNFRNVTVAPIAFFEMRGVSPENGMDVFSGSTERHLIAVPKSSLGSEENIAVVTGTKKQGKFMRWNSHLHYPKKCLGYISCDYVLFDVPLDGYYSLVSVSQEKKDKKNRKYFKELKPENTVSVKVKKYNNAVTVFADNRDQNIMPTTQLKTNKHTISKTDKLAKEAFSGKFIVVKVVKDKTIYGCIKRVDQVHFRKGKNQFVVRRLKRFSEREWEAEVHKYCSP